MESTIFMTSLYKTSIMLTIVLILTRIKYVKILLQKEKLNKIEVLMIALVFSFLGCLTNHLPYHVYGTSMSTIRVIIISGGVLFGPFVSMISSVIISMYMPIVDLGCDTIIPEIMGILTSGIISGSICICMKKNNITPNLKWIVGIIAGVFIQYVAYFYIVTYSQIVPQVESIKQINMRDVNFSMAVSQVLIGIFVMIIQDIYSERKIYSNEQLRGELNQAKLQVLQSQINPHFLFNTLNVIGALTSIDPNQARETIVRLSKYIRYNLELHGEFIPIKDEIEQVKCYVDIQKTRFEDEFEIFYNIDENINVKIPSLVMQPLIENALEHGILKSGEKGQIYVNIEKYNEKVRIVIRNTGIPIEEEIIENLYKDNMLNNKIGLKNVHTRLKIIYGSGIKVHKLENGTQMEFYVGGNNEGDNN